VYCVGMGDEGSRLVSVVCQFGHSFLPVNDVLQDASTGPVKCVPY
jgi:hypothetical protein